MKLEEIKNLTMTADEKQIADFLECGGGYNKSRIPYVEYSVFTRVREFCKGILDRTAYAKVNNGVELYYDFGDDCSCATDIHILTVYFKRKKIKDGDRGDDEYLLSDFVVKFEHEGTLKELVEWAEGQYSLKAHRALDLQTAAVTYLVEEHGITVKEAIMILSGIIDDGAEVIKNIKKAKKTGLH